MGALLPAMLATGLCEPLALALAALATHVPSILPEVQRRLLDIICLELTARLPLRRLAS